MSRTMRTPGVALGTRIIDWRLCTSGCSGAVWPITISSLQSSFSAPEVNHLRPLMT